ncbi:MAG: type II secretion system protein GspM [Gammaproteobacteria bacterium]|nr:type II secretion system protein GspM [Gammaproteobacteria bacterium]
MNSRVKQYTQRFDALPIRERALIALTLVALVVFVWWTYYANPLQRTLELQQAANQRVGSDTETLRASLRDIRQRMASGPNRHKETQLASLGEELSALEEQLRVETIELIDPEKMFELMNQLIYRESGLTLLGLKRREVKSAIPPLDGQKPAEDPGVYRHVLEIEFSGRYPDILRYLQSMEKLDWKLLWDEIEIVSEDHPRLTVRLVMSTLSTRKEWVGI